MRRAIRILGWVLGVVLLLPVVAVGIVFAGLNTEPGRELAERLVGRFTGGTVVAQGLGGRFPDALRLRHLEVRDKDGAWLSADDVLLDWSPTALVHRQAKVEVLRAGNLVLARLPAAGAKPAQPAAPSQPFSLPVRVTVDRLDVRRAELGRAVAGTAAVLAVTGGADVRSLQDGSAHLVATPEGGGGRYEATGTVAADAIDAHLVLDEPAGGLVAHVAALPDIGALHLDASVKGPRSALATALDLRAGPLRAGATGSVDLVDSRLSLDATAAAPAMQPAPGVSWEGIDLRAHVAGPFTAPDATGHLVVTGVAVAGAGVRSLTAELSGNAGQAAVRAVAEGVRLPGPKPDLLAGAPLRVTAEARLDDPARPVRFTVDHPLLSADGTARTGGNPLTAHVALRLPDLAPIGAIAAVPVAGHGALTLDVSQEAGPGGGSVELKSAGTLALLSGPGPSAALIGRDARLGLDARLEGGTVVLRSLTLDGAAVTVAAAGTNTASGLDATVKVGLANLSLLAPTLNGTAALDAHVHGPANALAADATLTGDVGAAGVPRAPVKVVAAVTGLPGAPAGHITATGTLAGAPVDLVVDATRGADGALDAAIRKADWRSLHAEGDLVLPQGATLPVGHVAVRMARLDDLRPFVGQALSGGVTATAELTKDAVQVDAEATGAGTAAARVARATLKARVADPLGHRTVVATLVADGVRAGAAAGNVRVEVSGPEEALAIRTTAKVDASGTDAAVAGTAVLDVPGKLVRIETLTVTASNASVQPETARLLGPATVRFGDGVAVDRLRLGVRQAVLDVAGRVSPTLDLTATLRTPADIGAAVSPSLALNGTVAVDAKLTGSLAAPAGTVRLTATGLRARTGPAAAFPAANVTATAMLAGTSARVDARVAAGSASLSANGTVPLGAAGALNVRTAGSLDLVLLDPILTPDGRRARGRVALDLLVAGTVAAPSVSGSATLSGGEVQDFAQGARITDLNGTVRADGQVLRIVGLQGRAGQGTVALSGTVGAFAPGIPVDLALTMRNARPLSSDLVTAVLDADLTLKGPAAGQQGAGLQAAGKVTVRSAELRLPRTLPASVVTLDVRRPGDKPPGPVAPPAAIGLDLVVDAPQGVFVRGRGVEAEMGGRLVIRGSSVKPGVSGGLEMRRGSISIAGTTLNFSRGKVGFDGVGVTGRIDPTLDFAADSTTSTVVATLGITGYVSKPKITLTSVPALPQDEVLAYLLFKRSAKELGPFQIAEIAAALAELTGVGGGGLNPLDSVRKGLGLDRLSVGSGATPNSGPTLEAGRYIGNGVYVGAKQGTTGGAGTQATVQIDITKGLKLQTDVGAGTGGNQVGVTYQFEY